MRCALRGEIPTGIDVFVLLGKTVGAIGGILSAFNWFANCNVSGGGVKRYFVTWSGAGATGEAFNGTRSGFTRSFPVALSALLIVFSAFLTS